MANGTRTNSYTDVPTDLYFEFSQDNQLTDAYEVQKVEIYPSATDAANGTNLIETISSGSISNPSTGTYSYTAAILSTVGVYYDKVYAKPTVDLAVRTFTGNFFVRERTYGGSFPGSHHRVLIYLNVFDILDEAQKGDKVYVQMNTKQAWYGNDLIKGEREIFTINASGQVVQSNGDAGMYLIETDTLTADTFPDTGDDNTVYYKLNVAGKFQENFEVPKSYVQANYKELPKVTEDN